MDFLKYRCSFFHQFDAHNCSVLFSSMVVAMESLANVLGLYQASMEISFFQLFARDKNLQLKSCLDVYVLLEPWAPDSVNTST